MEIRRTGSVLLLLLAWLPAAGAVDGLVKLESGYSVDETLDRFEAAVKGKGMTVFARIDHAKGARAAGKALRPTQVLVFGNPPIGALLMQSKQTVGIDLPMKALAWKDGDGRVWLAYNDPGYLVGRHRISGRDAVVAKMRKALDAFARRATAKTP